MVGWLIALAVIVLLGCVPLGISARYNEGGPLVRIIAGPIRILLYPQKKNKAKTAKNEPKKKSKQKPAVAKKHPEQKGGSIKD